MLYCPRMCVTFLAYGTVFDTCYLLTLSITTFCSRDLTKKLECAVLRSTGYVHISLIDANKSILTDLCLINAILTVVYLKGPV